MKLLKNYYYIPIVIIGVLIVYVFLFSGGNPIKFFKDEQSRHVPANEKQILRNSDYYVIDIVYPTTIAREDILLTEIEEYIKNSLEEIVISTEGLVSGINDGTIDGENFVPYTLTIAYESYETDDLYSFVLGSHTYTGGAHGNSTVATFTYSKKTEAIVTLSDLFVEDSAFVERLHQVVEPRLIESIGTHYSEEIFEDSFTQDVETFSTFYVTDEDIIFVYSPYEVAPYSAGIQKVVIPKRELVGFLE